MGSNIATAKVTIRGTRPIFWHRFGPDALPLEKQERTGVAGNDPEEWRKTVLMTAERQLYLDGTQAFAAIRDGAKYTKDGRGSIQPKVAATLQIMEDVVLVNRHLPAEPLPTDVASPVYLDVRGVRNPSTKARNVRYRVAASPGWEATFTVLWDKTIVATPQLQASLIDAGKLVGIGDGRSVGFGRFDVVEFAVQDS